MCDGGIIECDDDGGGQEAFSGVFSGTLYAGEFVAKMFFSV